MTSLEASAGSTNERRDFLSAAAGGVRLNFSSASSLGNSNMQCGVQSQRQARSFVELLQSSPPPAMRKPEEGHGAHSRLHVQRSEYLGDEDGPLNTIKGDLILRIQEERRCKQGQCASKERERESGKWCQLTRKNSGRR